MDHPVAHRCAHAGRRGASGQAANLGARRRSLDQRDPRVAQQPRCLGAVGTQDGGAAPRRSDRREEHLDRLVLVRIAARHEEVHHARTLEQERGTPEADARFLDLDHVEAGQARSFDPQRRARRLDQRAPSGGVRIAEEGPAAGLPPGKQAAHARELLVSGDQLRAGPRMAPRHPTSRFLRRRQGAARIHEDAPPRKRRAFLHGDPLLHGIAQQLAIQAECAEAEGLSRERGDPLLDARRELGRQREGEKALVTIAHRHAMRGDRERIAVDVAGERVFERRRRACGAAGIVPLETCGRHERLRPRGDFGQAMRARRDPFSPGFGCGGRCRLAHARRRDQWQAMEAGRRGALALLIALWRDKIPQPGEGGPRVRRRQYLEAHQPAVEVEARDAGLLDILAQGLESLLVDRESNRLVCPEHGDDHRRPGCQPCSQRPVSDRFGLCDDGKQGSRRRRKRHEELADIALRDAAMDRDQFQDGIAGELLDDRLVLVVVVRLCNENLDPLHVPAPGWMAECSPRGRGRRACAEIQKGSSPRAWTACFLRASILLRAPPSFLDRRIHSANEKGPPEGGPARGCGAISAARRPPPSSARRTRPAPPARGFPRIVGVRSPSPPPSPCRPARAGTGSSACCARGSCS